MLLRSKVEGYNDLKMVSAHRFRGNQGAHRLRIYTTQGNFVLRRAAEENRMAFGAANNC